MIITKNTESALLSALTMCWEKSPSHRCLHLKFSRIQSTKEEWLPQLYDALDAIHEASSCQVYICQDDDVFVISRSFSFKRLEQFLAHLTPKLEPAPAPGLATLFEVGIDWWRLRTICERKIEAAHALASVKKPVQESAFQAINTFENLDKDLLSSLSMRREIRAKPEILIVEDDAFSRRLINLSLEKEYSLTMASDGQGAVYSYVNKAPDMVFLDINLPDIDGHAVLEIFFKLDPQAFVVMFSGNGDKDNILRSLELGAKGFVGKPFAKEKLFQYIAKSPFIQAKQQKVREHGYSVH